MITMGSVFCDGTDFRDEEAKRRAKKYLDNENVCKFFSDPKAFLPLKVSDGLTEDQQLSFYLPEDTIIISAFNFSDKEKYRSTFNRNRIGLKNKKYIIKDFLTNNVLSEWKQDEEEFTVEVNLEDAALLKLYPVNDI